MEMQLWTLRILFLLRSDPPQAPNKANTQSFRHHQVANTSNLCERREKQGGPRNNRLKPTVLPSFDFLFGLVRGVASGGWGGGGLRLLYKAAWSSKGVCLHVAKSLGVSGSAIKRSPRLLRCYGGCEWFSSAGLHVGGSEGKEKRLLEIFPI